MSDSINLSCFQGDNLILNIIYRDPNGNLIDLTGFDVFSSVRDQFGGKVLCAECSIGDGITIYDVDDGSGPVSAGIRVNYSPAKTNDFNYPKSAIQVKIASNDVEKTLLYGVIEVRKPTIYV